MFVLTDGTVWNIAAVFAGAVFIFRDYAQKEAGNKLVLITMVVAAAISYLLASPFIAFASMLSFVVSEFVDYLVFTFAKCDFRKRVILSSLVSVPVDTFIFLTMIQNFSTLSFIVMIVSKLTAISIIAVRKTAL